MPLSLIHHRVTTRARRIRFLLISTFALLFILDHAGLLLVSAADDYALFNGSTVSVIRVIDGDTIDVRLLNAHPDTPPTRIRLTGIDCPEIAHENNPRPAEPLGDAASVRTASLVLNHAVRLIVEPHQLRDRYNRLLAHVEMQNGDLLNETLVREGLANASDRWPHAFLTRYDQAQREARSSSRGIWQSSKN